MTNQYKQIACGGTFDLFHAGHKSFLEQILNRAEKVILGLTSDSYVKTFKPGKNIASSEFRKKVLEQFLSSIGVEDRVQIVAIDDAYGSLLTGQSSADAIAVTSETKQTALEINQKRKEKQLAQLQIFEVEIKTAEDGKVLSATRIRNGEINREGRLYLNPKWQNKTLFLPESLRPVLQNPLGEVLNTVPEITDGSRIITIGDVTTQKFNEKSINQFLSIVDFMVQRQLQFHDLSELGDTDKNVQSVKNPHGSVTPELFKAIEKAFSSKEKETILVEGEEDLAVLPALLIAPLGFSIFYGQPNDGLVQVLVTEDNKEKAYQLVEDFDKSK
jgi:cytidyltransferase-like protein